MNLEKYSQALPYEDEDVVLKNDERLSDPPPKYKVMLLNDDYTTMEFVVDVLERFFSMGHEQAIRVMLEVHTEGVGVCGVYTRDIAETKVHQVITYARANEHPLMCTMEEA